MHALTALAGCCLGLAEGEAMQTAQARRPETTAAEYLERCALKTGRLFAVACTLGGRIGGLDESGTGALATFGRCLGLAFQIADDVLDCDGDPRSTGKPLGTDLLDGTPTLPLLHAARLDPDVAAALVVRPSPADVLPLLDRVRATGATAEARECALDFARRAEAALDDLGDALDTRALRAVARGVVNRDS
jgi:octaprenyl-diphosphate synthase